MATTLVTGGTGLVGYNIIASLLKRGRKVRALVRSLEKGRRRLPDSVQLVEGDITDIASIRKAMRDCEVVYHAAGFPEQWMKDPNIFEDINVNGTQNMLDVAQEQGIKRFIFTSTIDVFAGKKHQSYDESIIDPNDKGTYYERSKQEADKRAVDALAKGLPIIFIHPSGVYGPGPTDSAGTNDFFLNLYKGDIPVLLPGGFPLVYAPDVGEGHVLAELNADIGSRYILSESYYKLTDVADVVLASLKRNKLTTKRTPKKVPPVMPLPLAKVIAGIGEFVSGIINKPPLIPKGQLHFMQWQARPQSLKAQNELGWIPTPLQQGVDQTNAFLIKE